MISGTNKQDSAEIDYRDITDVTKSIDAMAKFYTTAGNVHSYTRPIGQHYITCFNPIDNKYNLSPSQKFTEVYSEILDYCENNALVKQALDTILKSAGNIEPETGINVQELLVKTWELGKISSFAYPLDLIIDNLKQNSLTSGGCLAGISGRLVQPYSLFILTALEDKLSGYSIPFQAPQYDEELQRALEISLREMSTDSPRAEKQIDSYEAQYEHDMAQALAISLKLAPKVHTPLYETIRTQENEPQIYMYLKDSSEALAFVTELSKVDRHAFAVIQQFTEETAAKFAKTNPAIFQKISKLQTTEQRQATLIGIAKLYGQIIAPQISPLLEAKENTPPSIVNLLSPEIYSQIASSAVALDYITQLSKIDREAFAIIQQFTPTTAAKFSQTAPMIFSKLSALQSTEQRMAALSGIAKLYEQIIVPESTISTLSSSYLKM